MADQPWLTHDCRFADIEDKNHVIIGQVTGWRDTVMSEMVHQIDFNARKLRGGYPDETMIKVADAMAEVLRNQ